MAIYKYKKHYMNVDVFLTRHTTPLPPACVLVFDQVSQSFCPPPRRVIPLPPQNVAPSQR